VNYFEDYDDQPVDVLKCETINTIKDKATHCKTLAELIVLTNAAEEQGIEIGIDLKVWIDGVYCTDYTIKEDLTIERIPQ